MATKVITATVGVNLANGNLVVDKNPPAILIDQATAGYSAGVQTIATVYTQITIGADVTTPGVSYWRNLDPTNYVELGTVASSVFTPFVLIKPGEAWPFRLATGTVYARAHAAAVKLENLILND